MVIAIGLIVLAEGTDGAKAGDTVRVQLFNREFEEEEAEKIIFCRYFENTSFSRSVTLAAGSVRICFSCSASTLKRPSSDLSRT